MAITTSLPKRISICNIYLPNSQPLELQDLEELIELPPPLILTGDFNSHHYLWDSPKTDTRGKKIAKLLENPNLILLNTSKQTHLNVSNGTFSAIDLSLCSSSLAQFMEWDVLNNLHDSDHFPIKITYEDGTTQLQNYHLPKWDLKKADWHKYKESINHSLTQIELDQELNPDNTDETIDTFLPIINSAIVAATGNSKTKTTRKRFTPWWDDDGKTALQKNHHAFNRVKKQPTTENLINFKKFRAIARKTIKESKKKSWETFTSTITSQTHPKEVWNKIKKINGNYTSPIIPFLEINNETFATDPKDITDTLAKKFQLNSSNTNYHPAFLENKRNAIVVPILKPNKNKHKPESYRPLALTNTMCKLLEKIINRRLRWYLEYNNILTPNQYGFRQYRSTSDILINLETSICEAFIKNEHLIATCFDIEKAYDMIWKPPFIRNFLTNRTIQVRVNGTISNITKIENGVPQGSVLSVTLFLIGINDITNALKTPVKAHLFADDLVITCSGKNTTTSRELI
ncbi:uncharacterized protein LOC128877466 [Hylaeus volcanicus]|uniref:uncharacterized protein LOC128877466 n=1 Tax=Hylaeus volcanicus TaxID=313075 RepID=UPI0023B7B7C9|nr:uncharacterized protein LOC128877466 [Hylaeus volcanicus]